MPNLYATRLYAADATVTVTSTSTAVTDWSRRYFGPWWNAFDILASSTCAAPVVHAEVNTDAYRKLAEEVTRAPHTTTTYAKAHTLITRDDACGVITAVSPHEHLAYRSEPATGRLTIYGRATQATATAAARLAREAMRGVLLRDGWTILHASAAVHDGYTLLTLGSKGAGKTTTALTLASHRDWHLLANDRVFIRHSTAGLTVLPWPSAAAVGLGLLDALGWYDTTRQRLQTGEALHPTQDPRVTSALLVGRREPLWDGNRELKAQIWPHQFTDWFNLRLATSGRAAALLFPRTQPDTTPAMLQAGRALSEHDFMSGTTEDRYPDLFDLTRVNGGGTATARRQVAEQLAALPHHSVSLGHDVTANTDFLTKLIPTAWA